ncbi:hypothetical protein ACWDBW_43070 [Streptomyces sp. NPDC001107]
MASDIEIGAPDNHGTKPTVLRGVNGFSGNVIFEVVPGTDSSSPSGDIDGIGAAAANNAVGVSGMGVTGVVGWVATRTRDKSAEKAAMAGVLGMGDVNDANSPGVVGQGRTAILGTGGETGVSGQGESVGVHGKSIFTGVKGEITDTDPKNTGAFGVQGISLGGAGVFGQSSFGPGGLFSSGRAQVSLDPHFDARTPPVETVSVSPREVDATTGVPLGLPKKGNKGDVHALVLSFPERNREEVFFRPLCTLWLCVEQNSSVGAAKWVQILTGSLVEGDREDSGP